MSQLNTCRRHARLIGSSELVSREVFDQGGGLRNRHGFVVVYPMDGVEVRHAPLVAAGAVVIAGELGSEVGWLGNDVRARGDMFPWWVEGDADPVDRLDAGPVGCVRVVAAIDGAVEAVNSGPITVGGQWRLLRKRMSPPANRQSRQVVCPVIGKSLGCTLHRLRIRLGPSFG